MSNHCLARWANCCVAIEILRFFETSMRFFFLPDCCLFEVSKIYPRIVFTRSINGKMRLSLPLFLSFLCSFWYLSIEIKCVFLQ